MQDVSEIVIDAHEDFVEDTKTTAAKIEKRVSAFVSDSKEQVVKGAEHVVKAAKENPRTAIAAGAAVVVGAIAAAAIPAIRAATKSKAKKPTTAAKRPAAARKPAAKSTAAKASTAKKTV